MDALTGERDYRLFLNPKNELYREMKMKQKPPSRAARRLMSKNPNLIRRPILAAGKRVAAGFAPEEIESPVRS